MIEATLQREAEAVLQRHARTFRRAAWFLPKELRSDVAVVYAFCRELDELADRHADSKAIDEIRGELAGESSARPLVAAYLRIAEKYGIPSHVAEDLRRGVASDLGRVRVGTDRELVEYAYRVAGTVGWMMACMLGVHEERAIPMAIDLGIAMQLTNIARDVAEDAQLGRVYLPADRLMRAGVPPESLVMGTVDRQALATVVCDILRLAEDYYESADQGMRYLPWRVRGAIVVAARGYRAIGLKLLANGGDAWGGRTVLTASERTWALLRGVFAGLSVPLWKVRPTFPLLRGVGGAP